MTTEAQQITQELQEAGVEVCFGLPGVHNLPLWDAIRQSNIRLIGVRHEQAAVYAADGYARATGRIGVALTTTGPGAANTLGALGEAWASRSPVLVIATDIPSALRQPGVYRGVLHEATDQAAMFEPVVKRSLRLSEETGAELGARGAIAIAMQPPTRPVYLEVPTDMLLKPTTRGNFAPTLEVPTVDARELNEAADLLAKAERPLIWVGSGGRDAAPQIQQLAEKLAAPVLTTYGARGILEPHHPCCVGLPPHVRAGGDLWDQADVVLAIGSDFDGMNTQNWAMPQPHSLIAVNADARDAAKNYEVDLLLHGDATAVTNDLCELLKVDRDTAPLEQRLHHLRAEAATHLDERALRFLDALTYGLPDDAVVVADMCIPGYWIGGFFPFAAPRKLQYPVGWGTLGFAFPAALGASLTGRGPVVSISGDGGFLFSPGELATMAQERLPFTAVIIDDGCYGMLRYDQVLAGCEPFGVDLQSPDFVAVAEAFGVKAEGVDDLDEEFGEALARHTSDPEPSVLVARAPSLTPPPTTSPNWYRRRH